MAGTEIAAKITLPRDGYAAKMCADAYDDKPFGVGASLLDALGIAEGYQTDLSFALDFGIGPSVDEHGSALPLLGNRLARLYGLDVHLACAQSLNRLGRLHGVDHRGHRALREHRTEHTGSPSSQVIGETLAVGVANCAHSEFLTAL